MDVTMFEASEKKVDRMETKRRFIGQMMDGYESRKIYCSFPTDSCIIAVSKKKKKLLKEAFGEIANCAHYAQPVERKCWNGK